MAKMNARELLGYMNGVKDRYAALCRIETELEQFNFLNSELPEAYRNLHEAHEFTMLQPDYKYAVYIYNGLYIEARELSVRHGHELNKEISDIK